MPNIDAVSQRIGRAVARRRTEAGVKQEDVAAAARQAGLSWTRATVASLETGRRQVVANELLLLPLVVKQSCGGAALPLSELVDGAEELVLSERYALPARYAKAMLNGAPARGYQRLLTDQEAARVDAAAPAHLALLNELPESIRDEAWRSSREEAAHRAAAKLGVLAGFVGPAAYLLWGRSFTAERDRRVDKTAADDENARTSQARRGHVTRELHAELREFLRARVVPGVDEGG